MASADEKPWDVEAGSGRSNGLHVILLKREYVLPWTQFLYAEGSGEEVRVVFSTHDVIVRGSELNMFLSDVAAQRVRALKEPERSEKFQRSIGAQIREVEVHRVQSDNDD